ncbi:MAG TPA: trigger factor [Candidatus Saccharimonadales bacterium]|nr:trigger factor [Candidatus Saccharimonadales bacterium]
MQVNKKDLAKSQLEIVIELSVEEFAPYIEKGAQKVSETVKIEGFRPGKVPFDILKQKVGEMSILEEAAHIAITKTVDDIVEKETMGRQPVGQPSVNITKLAPGNPLEYKVIISLLPTITLGNYKNLGLKQEAVKIETKELDRALNDLREMRASEKIVDREVKDGDKVIATVHMFLDKVQLEDGHHHDITIMMGKDYFVPGFDKNILGMKKDEERTFSLPYPDDHHQKNLAGKMVEFKVGVKGVYERILPELNDEFATFFQLKDLAELKKNLEESLLHEKKHNADLKNESEMISKISDKTKFGDFPDALVESESKNLMLELEQSVIKQGGKFEDYLNHLNKTKDALMLELMPNAIKRVKAALIIREIAMIEKIFPTEKEINDKVEELKKQYANNKEVLKMLAENGYATYLNNILTNEHVLAKLKEWNYADSGHKQKS